MPERFPRLAPAQALICQPLIRQPLGKARYNVIAALPTGEALIFLALCLLLLGA